MTKPLQISNLWLSVLSLLVCGLIWSGCRSAKPIYQNAPTSSGTGDDGRTVDAHHVFQVGELVTIYYPGTQNAPQVHEERIKEDGTVTLPRIGPLAVAGKTQAEVQKLLQENYASILRPLVVPPPRQVRVYFAGGEVRTPGPKVYIGKTTVSTAIQAAGDVTESANTKKVKLIHPDGRREIITDLLRMHSGHDPEVYPGDRIEVPRKWWR